MCIRGVRGSENENGGIRQFILLPTGPHPGRNVGWLGSACFGRPKVKLSIANAPEMQIFGQIFTSLRIEVSNERRWWTVGPPALGCRGKIVFYSGLNGHDIFGQPMAMRWSNRPHPEPTQFRSQNGLEFQMWDTDRFIRESRMDINPGEAPGVCHLAAVRWTLVDWWGLIH